MKRPLLALLLVVSATPLLAQGPNDLDEGIRLTYDMPTNTYSLSWWGRSGIYYFVKETDDMLGNWSYWPAIISGQDQIIQASIQNNHFRGFWRLEIETDPYNSDSDGDFLSNAYEVLNGLHPRFADSDGDGMPDGYEINFGLNPYTADSSSNLDGDGVINGQDARPNNAGIGQLSITVTAPLNNAVIP